MFEISTSHTATDSLQHDITGSRSLFRTASDEQEFMLRAFLISIAFFNEVKNSALSFGVMFTPCWAVTFGWP